MCVKLVYTIRCHDQQRIPLQYFARDREQEWGGVTGACDRALEKEMRYVKR